MKLVLEKKISGPKINKRVIRDIFQIYVEFGYYIRNKIHLLKLPKQNIIQLHDYLMG